MTEYTDQEITLAIRHGIAAAQSEDYLRALTLLQSAYASQNSEKTPDGLSYYGLCLALVERKIKPAIDLCKRAIELQFYHGEHYANLARVYMAGGNRRKAVETLAEGLRVMPENAELKSVWRAFGQRSRPVIPFLSRDHALNVFLGRVRHARKVRRLEDARKSRENR
ncbi:MAG: hypothetical protein WBX15_10040 [Thermoanaerobaculia bacterium]